MGFANRVEAGQRLAELLVAELGSDPAAAGLLPPDGRPLVLGLPRGGVPVAAPVAAALGGELDVLVVRKIPAPGHPELGLGAVTASGPPVFDAELLSRLRIDPADLEARVEAGRAEVARRLRAYRGDRPPPVVTGRVVVVVDDGLATGVSARAALQAVREQEPALLVLAVPVAAADRADRLARDADRVVAVLRTERLVAVGRWYGDFRQLTDEQVIAALNGG